MKSSSQVKQIFGLFCKLVALILLKSIELPKLLNKSNLKEPGGPGSKILFAETVLAKIFQTKYYDQDCTLIHRINTTQNKIPDTSGLVTTTVLNIKLNEVENKIPNPDKYIATRRFNKLTTELFAVALK